MQDALDPKMKVACFLADRLKNKDSVLPAGIRRKTVCVNIEYRWEQMMSEQGTFSFRYGIWKTYFA